jgi:hypothetical protein
MGRVLEQMSAGWFARQGTRLRDDVAFQPQRGYVLQPRVAAAATLGTRTMGSFNRNAVTSALQIFSGVNDATALRLRTVQSAFPG